MNLQTDKELYDFLSNAPKEFTDSEKIKKFQLKNGDFIHCVLWNMHFYITGTDIVKILVWRFQNAGRQIVSLKKFEEGVFSDLRNLKPGIDATLEGPRSDFLEFLYKNGCIRTQKKQKVFFWYSVPHDALFCDALERDLRRETNLYAYSKYYSNKSNYNMPFKYNYESMANMNPNMNMPPNMINPNMVSNMNPNMMNSTLSNNLNGLHLNNSTVNPNMNSINPALNNSMSNHGGMIPNLGSNIMPTAPSTTSSHNQSHNTHNQSHNQGHNTHNQSHNQGHNQSLNQSLNNHNPSHNQNINTHNQTHNTHNQSLNQFYNQQFQFDPKYKEPKDQKQPEKYKEFDYSNQYDNKYTNYDEMLLQMPDLDDKTDEFVEPDMIIPNKGGKSEQ